MFSEQPTKERHLFSLTLIGWTSQSRKKTVDDIFCGYATTDSTIVALQHTKDFI